MMKYHMPLVMLLVVVYILPSSLATEHKDQSIPLLALAQTENGTRGDIATLTLEIRPGSGRVFVDTFPLTQVTTQISMRFAQQVACKEVGIDCSDKDFVYTITSQSGIVGGPSAGSAAAVLTAAVLRGDSIEPRTVITGTINSGGFIGPVGGIAEKTTAALHNGMTTILIPQGTRQQLITNASTLTDDRINDNKEGSVTIQEVATLSEALSVFTNRPLQTHDTNIKIDRSYVDTMQFLSTQLCNRAKRLYSAHVFNETVQETIRNLTAQSDELISEEKYYSSASLCFRSNVLARTTIYLEKNYSRPQQVHMQEALLDGLLSFESTVDLYDVRTITDLQAIAIVKERILEARDTLKALPENNQAALIQLAYAEERLASARSWATFLGKGKRPLPIDFASTKKSCQQKIEEAEERRIYLASLLPQSVPDSTDLNQAMRYMHQERYDLCLFKAAQAKAHFDVVLSVFGSDGNIQRIIETKLDLAKKSILSAQDKNIFPIVAYSYYEYADVLQESDTATALLFAEYALELSNFDMYFEDTNEQSRYMQAISVSLSQPSALIIALALFIMGTGTGVFISKSLFCKK